MLGTSIGIKPDNTTLIIARIKKGLPAKAFTLLKKNLNTTDRELAGVLGIPISTLARRKKNKRFPFGESERMFRIARIYDKAVMVFGNDNLARKWLKERAFGLGDVAPIDYARSEIGAHEVENLLGRIEDGVFS